MMPTRPLRARRVQLAVPGSNEKMIAKAAASAADHVFLDLEDAVAPREKKAARGRIVEALRGLDWTGKVRCVRINDLRTRYAYDDVIEVVRGAGTHLDTIMIPKVMDARDVHFVETLLGQLELDLGLTRPIGIEALIEDVHGMKNVERIAECSQRLESLIFGMGDYSASQKMDARSVYGDTGYPGDLWHYGRYKLVIAARANGLDPIDGPLANFRELDLFCEEARRALILGFSGKWAIHPSQVAPALEIFTPPADQVARARRMIGDYRQAESEGLGAIQVDGQVVDAATVRILQNVLDRADVGKNS
jgi:citrate lyase subunit beta/citryl-CoA lyase